MPSVVDAVVSIERAFLISELGGGGDAVLVSRWFLRRTHHYMRAPRLCT